ncbi:DUF2441 domain-containing protein [Ichthyenterobacterium sp. W332]|uniref:DUF2441 domain-containing protein n=1 Tax=Microcosmobacter mediterraneus TaxID=3075607 RepID=A0ABU2YLU3_9FLAO|nr:DUF2441 domain-containing protein [Ichthyenterobacterium sp. W332]MDT0559130.1 DUF2441 domain-containing protein [Ichthyenterobacterium sp. W332]
MNYYHIQKINRLGREWSINEIIDTSINSENSFIKDIVDSLSDDYYKKYGDEDILLFARSLLSKENCDEKFSDYSTYNNKKHFEFLDHCRVYEDLVFKFFKTNQQYLKWIREDIFEKTRLKINPDLPSRKKGIWICDINELHRWWEILKSQNRKIFKIELIEGKTFTADEKYCEIKNFSIKEFEENANNYWNGKTSKNSIIEVIFEGKLKVLQSYNSLEELNGKAKS